MVFFAPAQMGKTWLFVNVGWKLEEASAQLEERGTGCDLWWLQWCKVQLLFERILVSLGKLHMWCSGGVCNIWGATITAEFCRWGLASVLFWRKRLSYLIPGETARPEKEEAARSEVLKPWIWTRFKTDVASAFTSYQRKPSVTGLLAQTWKYKPVRELYNPVLWTTLVKSSLSIKIYLLHTPHWVGFFPVLVFYYHHKKAEI